MSEEIIIRHCSPTLAGLKTGNLFRCPFRSIPEICADIRRFNQLLSRKGLRIIPLAYSRGSALIYVYRPSRLLRDLADETTGQMLRTRGYCVDSPERCLACLIRKLGEEGEFPHEIGLFLGYPPEDVRGFIENRTEDCKCLGCWKVYGDVGAAKKTFAQYKSCTESYFRQWRDGRTLEGLTVTL